MDAVGGGGARLQARRTVGGALDLVVELVGLRVGLVEGLADRVDGVLLRDHLGDLGLVLLLDQVDLGVDEAVGGADGRRGEELAVAEGGGLAEGACCGWGWRCGEGGGGEGRLVSEGALQVLTTTGQASGCFGPTALLQPAFQAVIRPLNA